MSAPIRCIVVQMARMGDTLQSLMALRAAKQLYPELQIHFVARSNFAAAAHRIPWIEKVIPFPSDELLAPVIAGTKSQSDALAGLAQWLAPLVKETWDFAVNWTYSDASSYLTALLPAKVKLGYTRARDGTSASADGWSHYIQAIVQGGVHQNIHLTDILTTQLLTALQIHVGEPANAGDSAVTSKNFFSLEIGEREIGWSWRDLSKKWLAIQLGSAQVSKSWSPENWAKVASYVVSRHPECSFVLLGGKEDQKLVARFMEALDPAIRDDQKKILSLVGETDFDLWASVVSRCQWLFSGDTAAIHLASVLGTRVLNVSVGPVRWTETGPYGNGHYVVCSALTCAGCASHAKELNQHSCQADVTPESVYATWSYGSSEWSHRRTRSIENHFADLSWSKELSSVRVFRSKIRNSNDGGGVVYEPLCQRGLSLNDWSSIVMGHVARAWYCGWVPQVGQELIREMIRPELIQKLRELDESTQLLLKICQQAVHTAEALKIKSSSLKSNKVMGINDRQELQCLGATLQELEKLGERLSDSHPPLRAFTQMSKVLMHNLRGDHLSDIGRETAESYRQLQEGLTILKDWVKFTLNFARPVAVKSAHSSPTVLKEVITHE